MGFRAHSRGCTWSLGLSPLSLRPVSVWPPDDEGGSCLLPGIAFLLLHSAATWLLSRSCSVCPGVWPFSHDGFGLGLDEAHEGQAATATVAGLQMQRPHRTLPLPSVSWSVVLCTWDQETPRGVGAALPLTGSQMCWEPRLCKIARHVCAPVPGGRITQLTLGRDTAGRKGRCVLPEVPFAFC